MYKGGCSNIHHGDHAPTSNQTASDSNSNSNKHGIENISSTLLTEAQEQLLAHRPNFVVGPRCLPFGEYILAV